MHDLDKCHLRCPEYFVNSAEITLSGLLLVHQTYNCFLVCVCVMYSKNRFPVAQKCQHLTLTALVKTVFRLSELSKCKM